jgi:hypothetical protein
LFGYISIIVWLVLHLNRLLGLNLQRITTNPVNTVWLETPAHADTLKAITSRQFPYINKSAYCTDGLRLASTLSVTLASLPRVCDIFLTLLSSSPRTINNRLALFEFILQVICYTRSPQLAAVTRGPCILSYELTALNKAVALLTRGSGHRLIHVMHGLKHPNFQITIATDLVLLSKIDEPWFKARVDPSVRIWTIGHPRLEDIRRRVGPAHSHHDRLPRITFFSQPSEGDYTRNLRIADWRICAALKGKAEVRFRAHPREDISKIITDMAAAGIDFMQISDTGLIEDLTWCDAVASSWSTASMEAAACGRGIFWTCSTPERYVASQELRDHGIGILVQSAQDWEKPLAEWQSVEWREPIRVSEARLRELGMIGDMEKSWFERLEIE